MWVDLSQIGGMIDSTEHYILIQVWVTLTFLIQGQGRGGGGE